MHDTPQRDLFEKTVRAYSHGCIRVQNPGRLAEVLLEEDKGWSAAHVRNLLAQGGNNEVTLKKQIPVHITYFTVVVGDDGRMQSFGDLYGHDNRVSMALAGRPLPLEPTSMEVASGGKDGVKEARRQQALPSSPTTISSPGCSATRDDEHWRSRRLRPDAFQLAPLPQLGAMDAAAGRCSPPLRAHRAPDAIASAAGAAGRQITAQRSGPPLPDAAAIVACTAAAALRAASSMAARIGPSGSSAAGLTSVLLPRQHSRAARRRKRDLAPASSVDLQGPRRDIAGRRRNGRAPTHWRRPTR